MTTPNTSGGLQEADSGRRDAPMDRADLRLLCNVLMNHWYGDVEPGVAIGTDKAKFELNGATTCLIGGVPQAALTGAPTDYAFTAGHTSLGNSEACKILVIGKTTTGVETRQGPIVASSVTEALTELPAVPAGWAVLGEIYIKTGAAETFVFGTTELDAGATDATYRDLFWADTGPSALINTGTA
jgi:hypothetical protein